MIEHLFFCGHYWEWYTLFTYPLAIIIPAVYIYFDKHYKPSGFRVEEQIVILTIAIIMGFVAGKVFSYIEHCISVNHFPNTFKQWYHSFRHHNGTRWYGGLLMELVFFFFVLPIYNKHKADLLLFSVSVFLMFGITLGKLGCFLSGHNGCCGIETTLPWGMYFRYGTAYCGRPLHPIQLYDAVIYFSAFVFLVIRYKKSAIMDCYIVFFFISVYSFFVQFLKPPTATIYYFTFGQYIYILIGCISLSAFLKAKRNTNIIETQQ